jgi:hypothetical protein
LAPPQSLAGEVPFLFCVSSPPPDERKATLPTGTQSPPVFIFAFFYSQAFFKEMTGMDPESVEKILESGPVNQVMNKFFKSPAAKAVELKELVDSAKVREETRQFELEANKEAKKIELEAKKIELEAKKIKMETKKIELKELVDSAKVREETRQIELKELADSAKVREETRQIKLKKKKMKLSFFEKRMDTKMTKQLKTYQGELPQCPELVYHNAVHLMFLVAAALVFVFLRRRR